MATQNEELFGCVEERSDDRHSYTKSRGNLPALTRHSELALHDFCYDLGALSARFLLAYTVYAPNDVQILLQFAPLRMLVLRA